MPYAPSDVLHPVVAAGAAPDVTHTPVSIDEGGRVQWAHVRDAWRAE